MINETQSPATEKATHYPPCIELEPVTPDITNIPTGIDLALEFGYLQAGLEQLERYKAQLEIATTIYYAPYHRGIGDAVLALRQANALAAHFPNKSIVYIVTDNFPDRAIWALYPNLSFQNRAQVRSTTRDNPICHDPQVFVISDRGDISAEMAAISANLNLGTRPPFQKIKQLFDTSVPDRFAYPPVLCQPKSQTELPTPRTLCSGDILRIVNLLLLGIPLPADLFKQLLLPETESQPAVFDVLIIPDAHENNIWEGETGKARSQKSLSVRTWDEIAGSLPTGLKYGVVMGTSHPDYCEAVFSKLSRFVDVTPQRCATLADFATVVRQTSLVIGMDSGTTHFAREVALASADPIAIAEIFNASLESVADYGFRSLPQNQASILAVFGDSGLGLSDIDTESLVEFINSKIQTRPLRSRD